MCKVSLTGVSGDDESARKDAGTSDTCNCATDNEDARGVGRCANDGSSLENEDGGQERPFHGQDAIEPAERQLEGCGGK